MNNISLSVGLEEVPFKITRFSAGEIGVKVHPCPNPWGECKISVNLQRSDDIFTLLMLTDACRRLWGDDIKVSLVMPYVPYGRQDRVCDVGEALSLKVFCNLINAQGYESVEVWDCHSPVTSALIERVIELRQWYFVNRFLFRNHLERSNTVLVSPDAGALKKIFEINKECEHIYKMPVYTADKIRDTSNGQILDTIVHNSEHIGEKDFLIVDDICDGGRTFIELAKKLRPLTNGRILLYVTHGIFSRGCTKLLKYIDHIYTANPWAENVNEDFITKL